MISPRSSLKGPTREVDSDGIAWICFDDPDRKVNVLSQAVLTRFQELLLAAREDALSGEIRAVVIWSGKERGFMAGADVEAIREVDDPLQGETASRFGQSIFRTLEDLPVPTVAAVHGACMGGGVELSLACRYRVASDHASTRFSLPEVQLGILPGWGGTTRLPRLLGLQAALDMLLTGKTVPAAKARKVGLVEKVLPAAIFREATREFVLTRVQDGPVPTGAKRGFGQRLLEDTAPGRRIILHQARKQVMKSTGGHYPAPLKILEVVGASLDRPLSQALALEAQALGELLGTKVCRELLHIYFLREAARKGAGVEALESAPSVSHLGVVGAGVMGGGIAHLAASHGVSVRIRDIRHEAVSGALAHAGELFQKGVERRRLTRREAELAMERISGGLDFRGFGETELVVEAVVERLDVKRQVLAEVEGVVNSTTVLATNTSTLSIDDMAEVLDRPELLVGMHFFNPVHRMPLVEVIQGKASSPEAIALVYAQSVKWGKVPVVVRDGPGFLVNRILGPYLNEAGHLLGEGASMAEIDREAVAFGMPMGPLRLMDEVGIDVASHAGAVLHEAFGSRMEPAASLTALQGTGRTGKKGKLGFYRYSGGKEQGPDPDLLELLELPSAGDGPGADAIRARLILAMINEGARTLEDGIVASAGEVDLAMIMGTGFPPFRGGLLRFADELHPRTVLARLQELEKSVGPRFAPAPLVAELARTDSTFYQRYPGTR